MFNENNGQLSAELILLIGFLIIISIFAIVLISYENEFNIAILAAREGVNDGLFTDGVAIYPEVTYNDYIDKKQVLLHPNDIHLVKIDYKENGYDTTRNKTKIQFKVYVTSQTIKDKDIQNSAGDRINYNLRKSLAIAFNSTSMSNALFNPVYSKHYIFTTANVVWS